MAAWAMHRLGYEKKAETTFAEVKNASKKDKPLLESIHRWMNAVHPSG